MGDLSHPGLVQSRPMSLRLCQPLPIGACVLVVLLATPTPAPGGQVVTDGTLGPARTLSGPNFNITPDLGRAYANSPRVARVDS